MYNIVREMPKMKNKIPEEGEKTLTRNVECHLNSDKKEKQGFHGQKVKVKV